MVLKCSECGGTLTSQVKEDQTIYKCIQCGRERIIKTKIVETIDMSENANLDVLME